MNIIAYIVLFLFVWTVAGVWYMLANIGNKNANGKWWEWPLGFPALILAYIIGFIGSFRKQP